jgi:NADPH-dependent 2,4-dienoyl-CoA reductase/sulfur reductase-like enzyme
MTERLSFDVLVVGAGPAGLAAACAAAECGARVGLVDDNPVQGGQIWRGVLAGTGYRLTATWLETIRQPNVRWLGSTSVVAAPGDHLLVAASGDRDYQLRYDRLVLATGARELFLPFPGWTLPNVLGAGGLQAMMKMGLPVHGKRVIVAGSGPLLLAVAAYHCKGGIAYCHLESQRAMSRAGVRLPGVRLRPSSKSRTPTAARLSNRAGRGGR